jgi:serine/threonine protein phosphatase PrpC
MAWKLASAAALGAIHDDGESCQDSVLIETVQGSSGSPVLIAVVSDGAGSADKGRIGSEITCEVCRDEAVSLLLESDDLVEWTDYEIRSIIQTIQKKIAQRASLDQATVNDYSATLVAAVITQSQSLFIQVGDGAAVWNPGTGCEPALWPEESEYANTTYFVTAADALDHLQIRRAPQRPDFVCLFSDGLQYLVLDFKAKAAHELFFKTVESKMESLSRAELDKWLQAMLVSPQVTGRSDDDTSIAAAIWVEEAE